MPHHTYTVPLVTSDLRREETIHQICDALQYLDNVSSDIFKRISDRVSENHSQLKAVNQRIDLAQAKINSLKGSHKATKVRLVLLLMSHRVVLLILRLECLQLL